MGVNLVLISVTGPAIPTKTFVTDLPYYSVTTCIKPLDCPTDVHLCTGGSSSVELVIRLAIAGTKPHLYCTAFVHGTGIKRHLDQCSLMHAGIRSFRVELAICNEIDFTAPAVLALTQARNWAERQASTLLTALQTYTFAVEIPAALQHLYMEHASNFIWTDVQVRKSHCLVFLGGLDPGQVPFKTLFLMPRLT